MCEGSKSSLMNHKGSIILNHKGSIILNHKGSIILNPHTQLVDAIPASKQKRYTIAGTISETKRKNN